MSDRPIAVAALFRPAVRSLGSIAILVLTLIAGCAKPPLAREQSYVFGTLVEVTLSGLPEERAKALSAQVFAEFDRLHRLFHAWEPGPLTELNAGLARGEWVKTDPEIIAVIKEATRYAVASDHAFNPAIGRLVELWGFHTDTPRASVPQPMEVARIASAVPRLTDLVIAGDRVASRNPAVQLDFGGYVKGYALDRASVLLRAAGVGKNGSGALVNIGGNVLAIGDKAGAPWRIGIQHPRAPRPMAVVELRDGEAIGTSGDYERFFEVEGKRYAHVLDPRTGMPAQGMQSVSVLISAQPGAGAFSDAASKPLFVAGVGGWRAAARRIGVTYALVVGADARAYATPEMRARLSWEDESMRLTVIP